MTKTAPTPSTPVVWGTASVQFFEKSGSYCCLVRLMRFRKESGSIFVL